MSSEQSITPAGASGPRPLGRAHSLPVASIDHIWYTKSITGLDIGPNRRLWSIRDLAPAGS
jgi:hypothetical protein